MKSIGLDELATALGAYVDPHRISDLAPTGLQVSVNDPSQTIAKVALGVSANLALFRDAADWGADAIVVHHGLFWVSDDPEHDPARRFDARRAAFLGERQIGLLAYHLPLDAHPEVGNNAEIARRLGLVDVAHDFGDLAETDVKVGVVARAEPPLSLDDLVGKADALFERKVDVVPGDDRPIATVAIVSGGGSGLIYAAIERGVDAFLSGEGREWLPAVAREAGIAFLAAGHHASERFGVLALGGWITERFGLKTRFFPQQNPF